MHIEHYISIYTSVTNDNWLETYTCGLELSSYFCGVGGYQYHSSELCTVESLRNLVESKGELSLNIDVVSYYNLMRNRAKTIKRITGVSISKQTVRDACKKWFLGYFSSRCMVDKYIWCIMNARLMNVPVSFELKVEYERIPDTRLISAEWKRINSLIDEQEVIGRVERIMKRINKL